jgi:hypothetical protein
MKIIAHRGYWIDPIHRNTSHAFHMALQNGFGIETDVRDYRGELVISHDLPDEESMKFHEFMTIVEQYNYQPLALNIKSDGLSGMFKEHLSEHIQHFFFDMSIPETLKYVKCGAPYLVRRSEYEQAHSLGGDCQGVWMDSFNGAVMESMKLRALLNNFDNVVLVSPELHGYNESMYWSTLNRFLKANRTDSKRIMLCTDKPQSAKDYFNGY